jgi:fumarate reductase subunit D
MVRSKEPLVWAPFFAGAGIAAVFMPITIVVVGLLTAFHAVDAHRLYVLLNNPWVRLYLFVLISLSLFHAAHRLRFVLVDLGLKGVRDGVALACYGIAVLGTIFAAVAALHVF